MSLRDFVIERAAAIASGKHPPQTAPEIMADARRATSYGQGVSREPYKDAPERRAPPEPAASTEPPTPPGELFPSPSGDAFAGADWD